GGTVIPARRSFAVGAGARCAPGFGRGPRARDGHARRAGLLALGARSPVRPRTGGLRPWASLDGARLWILGALRAATAGTRDRRGSDGSLAVGRASGRHESGGRGKGRTTRGNPIHLAG